MAEAAHRILMSQSTSSSSTTILISAVGSDSFGRLLVDETGRMGMRTDGLVHFESSRSAVCNMVLDSDGNLVGGVADMDIISSLKPEKVSACKPKGTAEIDLLLFHAGPGVYPEA